MALSRPFKEDRLAFPLSTPLLQAIDGEMSLAVCPQVVSQVPQHSALCLELVLEVSVYRNVICAIFKHSSFTGWQHLFCLFLGSDFS